jgi:hypothetical protein
MTAHTCTRLTDGCYRCGLHRDEIRGWLESLMVTRKGVVHDPDCSYVTGTGSTATPWLPIPARNDRACGRCLDGELPTLEGI